MTAAPRPYVLDVPDDAIEDLRQRLARTRWPETPPGEPWATGTDPGYLRELVEHWRTRFDWRAQEARLNAFRQFKVAIDGIELHYIHEPGRGPAPLPLLLSHGWPGSVFEFLELIPRLTDPARFGGDPADAFTVIAPSLPGYGLSYAPGQPRFAVDRIADTFAALMSDVLGHDRFGVQGGDWGSFVSARIAASYPHRTVGVHLNMLPVRRDPTLPGDPSPEERRWLDELAVFLKEETGYQWIQGTRPTTLSFALNDSPAGLAAWIAEKFHAWSDNDGRIESAIDRDAMLADISLYWFTGCVGASFWPYYARMHAPWPIPRGKIPVPAGYAAFPKEILRPPRALAEQTFDIRRWTEMPRGGHFAAMEQPQALADEITAFFRPLRAS